MIKLLDCTLRDGGYVNDWNFGKKTINSVLQSLVNSGIDIIECGFISQEKETTDDKSVYTNVDFYIPESEGNVKFAAMINFGEFNPNDLLPKSKSRLDIIRVAFHKADFEKAVSYCDEISNKGYAVFLQPMNAMDYSEEEYKRLIELANRSTISVFYLVDTFGNMRKSDLVRLYSLIDTNLRKDIPIGFHSHNNMQLSFSNAQELIARHGDRDILIDSSIFGMGRGAGNLCTELMTQYLNENLGTRYNLLPILECIDDSIMPIYLSHSWGYSVPYYLAAINSCHPNYANYLVSMQTLCVKDINIIIKSIPADKKAKFDKELIKQMYVDYLSRNIDDSETLKDLALLCKGRKVLLLAPGKSLVTNYDLVKGYIAKYNPVVFSINHIPKKYKFDKIFISNLKRFKNVDDSLNSIDEKVLYTSNITVQKSHVLNYSSYLNDEDSIFDNSGLMLINILRKAGVLEFALAGYDGFDYVGGQNYYDNKLVGGGVPYEQQVRINEAMKKYFKRIQKEVNIAFVTPSKYAN